jgi:hypothetical protein
MNLFISPVNAKFKMNMDHRRGLFFDDPIWGWISQDWMIRNTGLNLPTSRSRGREAGGLVLSSYSAHFQADKREP